jgi:hypothetical protein
MALTSGMARTCALRQTYLSLAEDGKQGFSFLVFPVLSWVQPFVVPRP